MTDNITLIFNCIHSMVLSYLLMVYLLFMYILCVVFTWLCRHWHPCCRCSTGEARAAGAAESSPGCSSTSGPFSSYWFIPPLFFQSPAPRASHFVCTNFVSPCLQVVWWKSKKADMGALIYVNHVILFFYNLVPVKDNKLVVPLFFAI